MSPKSAVTRPSLKIELHQLPPDDLTAIAGIGKARREWLQNSFHVTTFRDLAQLSADEIETRMKAEGRTVSRAKIELWIKEAQRMAHANVGVAKKAHGWTPIAQFVVEFQEYRDTNDAVSYQTRVHHMEADRSSTWPGIDQAHLCGWMVEQLGELAGQPVPPTANLPDAVSQRLEQLLAEVQTTLQETATEQPTDTGSRLQPMVAMAGAPVPTTQPPITPTESSERLQRLLAKVQAAENPADAPTPTLPPVTMPPVTPAESSERFQRLLAKVQSMTTPPAKKGMQVMSTQPKSSVPVIDTAIADSAILSASDERRRRLLAKVQAHSAPR